MLLFVLVLEDKMKPLQKCVCIMQLRWFPSHSNNCKFNIFSTIPKLVKGPSSKIYAYKIILTIRGEYYFTCTKSCRFPGLV